MKDTYYCFCPICKEKFVQWGFLDLNEAKIAVELHEKEMHKGKQICTFGKGKGEIIIFGILI